MYRVNWCRFASGLDVLLPEIRLTVCEQQDATAEQISETASSRPEDHGPCREPNRRCTRATEPLQIELTEYTNKQWCDKLESLTTEGGSFWKMVRPPEDSSKNKVGNLPLQGPRGGVVYTPEEKVQVFGEFFLKVYERNPRENKQDKLEEQAEEINDRLPLPTERKL